MGTCGAQPKIQEKFPKLFRRIPGPPRIYPWPPAYLPNRAMPAHFANRAAAPGETLFPLLAISQHADRFGPVTYASRAASAQCQAPSGTPAKHRPNGRAEIRDRRESDAPRPTRDTNALPCKPNAQPDPGTRARV